MGFIENAIATIPHNYELNHQGHAQSLENIFGEIIFIFNDDVMDYGDAAWDYVTSKMELEIGPDFLKTRDLEFNLKRLYVHEHTHGQQEPFPAYRPEDPRYWVCKNEIDAYAREYAFCNGSVPKYNTVRECFERQFADERIDELIDMVSRVPSSDRRFEELCVRTKDEVWQRFERAYLSFIEGSWLIDDDIEE
jgi:hypothetical protein